AQDHRIMRVQDLRQPPERYAGVTGTPGLLNDVRDRSLFRNPAFLALNQADSNLYVSDAANHVLRRVQPGPSGRVETFAGTGTPGRREGGRQLASFNNPQGIALDHRGNLWVVDSGNHTIRRVRLATGTVETIAGSPGVPGITDGRGADARFRSPIGIAIEPEA